MANTSGFVYILGNEFYHGKILKIGYTDVSPFVRAKELSNATGVPGEFSVLCIYAFNDAYTAEQIIHLMLNDFRLGKKEFFDISLSHAHKIITEYDWGLAGETYTNNNDEPCDISLLGSMITNDGNELLAIQQHFGSNL